MNNTLDSSISIVPREIVSQSIVFPHCDVKRIVAFAITSKEHYYEIMVKNIKGLYTRHMSPQFLYTDFLRFIDVYRKMIFDLKEAKNLLEKNEQLFPKIYFGTIYNSLGSEGLDHSSILAMNCAAYEVRAKNLSTCLSDVFKAIESFEDQIFKRLVLVGLVFIAGLGDNCLNLLCQKKDVSSCSDWLNEKVGAENMNSPIHNYAYRFGRGAGFFVGAAILLSMSIWGIPLLNSYK